MRPFEILFLLTIISSIVRFALSQDQRRNRVLLWVLNLFGGAFLVLHLVIEQYRWQMVPLYLLFVGTIFASRVQINRPKGTSSFLRWGGILFLAIILMLFVLPPVLFPVNELPPPTGQFGVGTLTEAWLDEERKELYSDDPNDPREFVSQTWYPVPTGTEGATADYLPQSKVTGRTISRRLGLPFFLLDHLNLLETNSVVEAGPIDGAFPVLVFSPGYNSSRVQSTTLMEDLASHGYIVVALSHPYGGAITVFPDGRTIFLNDDTLIGKGEELRASGEILGDQWAGDIDYLLDQLAINNSEDGRHPLSGRYDLDTIGVFGHSTGGGATMVFCNRDARCDAALGMDAWLGPAPDTVIEACSSVPTYFLMSEFWPKTGNTNRIRDLITNSADATWVTVKQTGHYDFADLPFLSPLTVRLGISGGIDAYRGQEINRAFVRGFFDDHLKDKGSADFLTQPDPQFPEIQYGVPDDVSQNDS